VENLDQGVDPKRASPGRYLGEIRQGRSLRKKIAAWFQKSHIIIWRKIIRVTKVRRGFRYPSRQRLREVEKTGGNKTIRTAYLCSKVSRLIREIRRVKTELAIAGEGRVRGKADSPNPI